MIITQSKRRRRRRRVSRLLGDLLGVTAAGTGAGLALSGLLFKPLVNLFVFFQMVRAPKGLPTLWAHEALLTSVGPYMALELIRPSEALLTVVPMTDEGALSSVRAKVHANVRALPVHL